VELFPFWLAVFSASERSQRLPTMASKWKKAKVALGLNLCMLVPRTLDDDSPPHTVVSERLSDAALLSPTSWNTSSSRPTTPLSSFHGLKLSKSSSKSSKVWFSLISNFLLSLSLSSRVYAFVFYLNILTSSILVWLIVKV